MVLCSMLVHVFMSLCWCFAVLVMTVPRKYLPPVMHHYRMGTSLVLIQLLLGSLLMAIALYLLISMPVLNTRDVPHWSAASVSYLLLFFFFYHLFLFINVSCGSSDACCWDQDSSLLISVRYHCSG